MRSSWFFLLAALTAEGCASSSDGTSSVPGPPAASKPKAFDHSWRPGAMPVKVGDETDDGMVLESGKGTLEQRDVDGALARHVKALVACYDQAGAARRYASGQVALRFFVTREGSVSNVLVVESAVGNFAVERCLVDEGKRIQFPPPRGNRATDFEYSLQFRAGGDAKLVDWKDEAVSKQVAHLVARLAPCGALGQGVVRAVLYIEPGGTVGSVGLASPTPLDVEAATCAVEQMRRWKMRDKRRYVVRTGFALEPPAEPDAEPGTSAAAPRLVKRTSGRGH
jgi:TonB family protein